MKIYKIKFNKYCDYANNKVCNHCGEWSIQQDKIPLKTLKCQNGNMFVVVEDYLKIPTELDGFGDGIHEIVYIGDVIDLAKI